MSEIIDRDRRRFMGAAAMTIAAARLGVACSGAEHVTAASGRLPIEGRLPSFGGATGWLNSPPLTAPGLSGRLVLVNFWTYTCINWLRAVPHVRAWAGKYKQHALVVIGVHTPEFAFEKSVEGMKGIPIDDAPHSITFEFRRQWTRTEPFGNSDWHMIFQPDRVVIETRTGDLIAEPGVCRCRHRREPISIGVRLHTWPAGESRAPSPTRSWISHLLSARHSTFPSAGSWALTPSRQLV